MYDDAGALLVTKQRPASVRLLRVLGVVLAVAIVGAVAFWLGRTLPADHETATAPMPVEVVPQVSGVTADHVALLEKEIARLKSDLDLQVNSNRDLLTTLSQLERQLQIDESAYGELAQSLATSSEQVAELREEVSFYRNIISPDTNESGLRINDFTIRPVVDENISDGRRWRFNLMIVQSVRNSEQVDGTLTLEVEGVEGRIQKIVDAASLGANYDRQVKFQYLHRVQGYIDVPQKFDPIRVGVDFQASGEAVEPIKQWYPWPEA